ncbi:MAG: cell envelope integrity protein CreD [Bacteroidales bacterium]|jgi:inner membrane protein|nr:cell envelope integrity protein CreD [Bacteroidales bacterium]
MKNNQSIWTKMANSATVKAIIIGVLILLMFIPINMIRSLIYEREHSSKSVGHEISSKWGNQQTLTGPVIVVPFKYNRMDNHVLKEVNDLAYFLPEDLDIETRLDPEILYRSIYKMVVYQSDIKVNGSFTQPDFNDLGITPTSIDWENAFISIGISDMRGIRSSIIFDWNGTGREVNPGSSNHLIKSGVNVKIPLSSSAPKDTKYTFKFDIVLNGSQGIFFTPVGKTTHLSMTSKWNSPKFDGAFIPEKRTIAPQGFTAEWNVYNYNRNFPQMWAGNEYDLDASEFGAYLLIPVDHYQKSERSVKYAIMFIALTFLVFFLVELISRKRIHPLQYLLVSIGLILFYSLLLALSEHMNFNLAYLLSALSIILLITGYSWSIFRTKKQTALMGIFLTALYIFLYTILQLEDLALLIGSVGLFIALAVVMYISRKIDWYRNQSEDEPIS